jgi:hypothetical protein
MLNCIIKGCRESFSEILGEPEIRDRWFVGSADDWPQIAASGTTEIVLCPYHRRETFLAVLEIRKMQEN